VLAPGFYARHDMRTPALIAVGVLVFTQVLNLVLVPLLQHAALTLSIGIGAMVNALWLLAGLLRRGSYKPSPGWGRFLLQVLASSALLAVFLYGAASQFDWVGLQSRAWSRIGLMALVLIGSAAIYFVALWISGLKIRQLLRR
jgi:putative peptidoglycan lipid II flippase